MKIKVLIAAFFMLLFTLKAKAQPYIPMLNNSSWNIVVANFGGSQEYVATEGATVVIGPFSYKKITDNSTSAEYYLREDIATRRVYRRVNNTDELLYDFSLTNGSTVMLPNGMTYNVTVSSVNVNGGTRKKISLYHVILSTETWIEGVGGTGHPFRPTYEMPSDPYVYLTCSAQNGVNVFNHGIANGISPTDCGMLGISDFNYFNISCSPNPFKNELTITTASNFSNAALKMYNAIGQLVREVPGINGQQFVFNRDDLSNGIYYLHLMQEGNTFTQKVIISD